MINRNELARRVTLAEGGAISLSIAQVKEVQRLTLLDLAHDTIWDLSDLFAEICREDKRRVRRRKAKKKA